MRLHEEPTTQTDEDANNVRYDEYGDHPLVAMPSIPQQDPSDNTIEPRRRERVADPARELICCQRAVEAARAGHRFLRALGGPCRCRRALCRPLRALLEAAVQITNLRGALRRFRERLISCGVSLVSAIAPERPGVVTRCLFWTAAHGCSC